jgi:hypothetical protein
MLGRTMLLALALGGCGTEDEVAVAPPAPVAAPVSATHGGTLVPLRRHRVELVAHESGEVFGYLTQLDGQPLASPEGALLTVTITLDADHSRPVLLRWNGEAERHEARMRDAPVEGPADISLIVAGRPERGSVDRLPVEPALEGSGVAYAEAEEGDEAEDDAEDDADGGDGADDADDGDADEGGGRRGGSLRARARRLFGL